MLYCKRGNIIEDIFENKSMFSSYSEAIKYLMFSGMKKDERFVVFLDEFHTVLGISTILKNIYDNNPNIKIFASGSSIVSDHFNIFFFHPAF
jgi:predicted AAA+ superfamily ATPase